jgi:hypothetical protein
MNYKVVGEEMYRERECIHREAGHPGEFYPGTTYLSHLQRLRGAEAMSFSSHVAPFFWSDAERILVWLCDNCAAKLGLLRLAESPK